MASDYYRIEQAINYLADNRLDQPNLDQLAQHLGLSPFHFQRLFKRWVGISPKRFLQFLTVEHAKSLLAQSRSVLETTYEAGLSSPGRLHDLFINVEAVTPGQFKHRGLGLTIAYGMHDSPFGECLLAVTERGICALSFAADDDPARAIRELRARWPAARLVENLRRTKTLLNSIFPSDSSQTQRITLYLSGTNFQIKVWEALLRIPNAQLCSYEDIAVAAGNPGAVRAVAGAVGDNPIAFLIPCHRVIRKMGVFGNYHYGAARKKAIIGWEAAKMLGEKEAVG